jgi:hypothetical protein
MFTFPQAASRTVWFGQGDIWGEHGMLPYLGSNSLGLCYGMSAIWIKQGAPSGAIGIVRNNKQKILKVQKSLREMESTDVQTMLTWSAQDAELDVLNLRTYGEPASHVILDLLASNQTHSHILAFYYRSGGTTHGHAIGISFDSPTTGLLFDPNYGIGTYTSRSLLCDDLHRLLATYVQGGGHVTSAYLQSVDNPDAFGDFVHG